MRRSASANLPALNQNGSTANKAENRAIGGFLVTSLGRVTLGSLGFTALFETERLPYLPTDDKSRNKLVLHGSGNTSPMLGTPGLAREIKKPDYCTDTRLSRSEFSKMFSAAKKSKEWSEVEDFYTMTFQNAANLCATFKKDVKQVNTNGHHGFESAELRV